MSAIRLIANRLIKLFGGISKIFCYLFHLLFPKARFTIPAQAAPLVKSRTASKIPKVIWQTNFTNRVSLPVYLNYLFNRLVSPDFEYRYVSTEARLAFMEENASPQVAAAFRRLTDGAAQADLWRLFVLNHHGGVYMDIDAHAVWPLSKIIKPDDEELFLLNKQHYTNYFIASSKGNAILEKAIGIVVNNIESRNLGGGVYDLTGPTALNLAIGDARVNYSYYKTTCIQGSFTNEYFQYIDKPRGKWTYVKKEDLIRDDEAGE